MKMKNYASLATEAQAKELVERGAEVIRRVVPTDWSDARSLAAALSAESLLCILEDAEKAAESAVSIARIRRLRGSLLAQASSGDSTEDGEG